MRLNEFKKGHMTDAGIDIPFSEGVRIRPGETVRVQLPLQSMDLPDGVMGIPFIRTKFANQVHCSSTIIDPHYTGPVHVWLTNTSYLPVQFDAGVAVVQVVLIPFISVQAETKTNEPRTDKRDTTE